jgi:hypothetical protein
MRLFARMSTEFVRVTTDRLFTSRAPSSVESEGLLP